MSSQSTSKYRFCVADDYDYHDVQDLRNFLKIIKLPFTLKFLETIYTHSTPITIILAENYNFLYKIGTINSNLYDNSNELYTIEKLLVIIDYIARFSSYMFYLYDVEMNKLFTNENEKINNRIQSTYRWSSKYGVGGVGVGCSSYRVLKKYRDYYNNKPLSDSQCLELLKQSYSSDMTDILITNFINNKLITMHNIAKEIETKRNLFHLLFIEIISHIKKKLKIVIMI